MLRFSLAVRLTQQPPPLLLDAVRIGYDRIKHGGRPMADLHGRLDMVVTAILGLANLNMIGQSNFTGTRSHKFGNPLNPTSLYWNAFHFV